MTSIAMRPHRLLIPPASVRLRMSLNDRPVMSREQLMRLNARVISMTSADTVMVRMVHTARVITHVANDRILGGDDGSELELDIYTKFGARAGIAVETNQFSDSTLRDLVGRCETLARLQAGGAEELQYSWDEQDHYLPVALWHDTTVRAMTNTRETAVSEIVDNVAAHGFRASGFIGLMARSQSVFWKYEKISAFGEETDCEVNVTARTVDGKGSGWAGQAARDWSKIDCPKIAKEAAHIAMMNQGAKALEPGRRTAILSAAAVAQMTRHFAKQLEARETDGGSTGFSKTPQGGNKLGQRVFDSRIHMSSDPMDPEGGYLNYFGDGYAEPKMTWVENGVLKNLSYDVIGAMSKGKIYSGTPHSLRIGGGPSSIDAMIAACPDGIYVNRLSSVDVIDKSTGLMTGVTRDGCFLVRNGKIDRPVKNFRFRDSPFFALNKLKELGATSRAPFGFTPEGHDEEYGGEWPRRPMIVPPMMVEDFNFSSLADAV